MKRYIFIVLLVFSVHFAVPTLYQTLGIGEILRENFRYGDIIFENNPINFLYLIITQIIISLIFYFGYKRFFKNGYSVKSGIEFGLFYGLSAQVVGALLRQGFWNFYFDFSMVFIEMTIWVSTYCFIGAITGLIFTKVKG